MLEQPPVIQHSTLNFSATYRTRLVHHSWRSRTLMPSKSRVRNLALIFIWQLSMFEKQTNICLHQDGPAFLTNRYPISFSRGTYVFSVNLFLGQTFRKQLLTSSNRVKFSKFQKNPKKIL